MSNGRIVSSNPHIRQQDSTREIMLCVIVALLPATVFGIYNFGLYSAGLIAVTIIGAVLGELVFNLVARRKNTLSDLSAVVTGLLLALNLPPHLPLWMGALGGIFAIVVVKMLFGGLGKNFMNPALGARCFLMLSFARYMTDFECDAYSGATPLAAIENSGMVNVLDMTIGRTSGCIGETSVIAILLGACFLIAMGVIDLVIPGLYILSFSIMILCFGGHGFDLGFLSAHLAGGGLMLGAFFMATDYVTRPINRAGQAIYGILLGLLTAVFRLWGPSAEGVSFAIIIGNLCVPLIEKMTLHKPFGIGGKANE